MTSMDCPVCKKSFKLTKAEDPNEAWERHFSTTCTQVPGSDKPSPLQCASSTCQVILGPSNRFQCPLCRVLVCLGCRTVEAHQCKAAAPTKGLNNGLNVATASRINKFAGHSSQGGNSSAKKSATGRGKPKTAPRNSNGGKGNSSRNSNSDNTLKGSAQRRMERQQQATASGAPHQHHPVGVVPPPSSVSDNNSNSSSDLFDCPLCFQKFTTSTELVQHVDRAHNTSEPLSSSSSPATSPASASTSRGDTHGTHATIPVPGGAREAASRIGGGPEICPTCSQRFSDVMALIQHAESAHAGLGEGSNSSSSRGGDNGGGGDKCSLS